MNQSRFTLLMVYFTGRIVKKYREAVGLNKSQVAKMLGYTRQFQYKMEDGGADIPLSKVSKCCFLLKIPPEIMQNALLRGKCEKMRRKF